MSATRVRLSAALAGALLAACGARSKPLVREFDGARAFTYLEQQVRFGPRIPGTPAHDSTGDWILARLHERADTVIVQDIPHRTAGGQTIHLRNFLARFRPADAERVLEQFKNTELNAVVFDVKEDPGYVVNFAIRAANYLAPGLKPADLPVLDSYPVFPDIRLGGFQGFFQDFLGLLQVLLQDDVRPF